MIALVLLAWAEAPAPPPPAEAPAAPSERKPDPAVITDGELRLLGSLPPDVVLDTEGHRLGQGPVLDSRLRARVDVRQPGWRLAVAGDLFEGQLAGDPWDVRGDEDARDRELVGVLGAHAFDLRRLSVGGRIGPVDVEGGLTTSHWGLGMVANDGDHDPWFGRDDFGDRVLRVRLATRPLGDGKPLTVLVAGDRVVEDDTAEWSPWGGGEAAWQAIASALWADPAFTGGLYAVYRHQVEADGERTTDVGVLDGYAALPLPSGALDLELAAEGATILGRTSRAQSYNAREGLGVASAGLTGVVSMSPDPWSAALRAGWASGDGDPDDGGSHDFAFDRDFDVGMVLFDELQGAIDAAAYAQLQDPEHSGGAPDGAEALVAEGAFRRAAFVQPVGGVKPTRWLGARAGVLFAWATAPPSQPYATYRNGGVPTNHLGEPTEGYWLGSELDWALTVGDAAWKVGKVETRPALLVQGGHLFAGPNLGGGTVSLWTLTGRVRW